MITITAQGQTEQLKDTVEVTVIPAPDEIHMSMAGLILKPEESVTLKPILKSDITPFCEKLSFASSNEDVAVVDENGVVTAVFADEDDPTTVITITTCNGLTAECLVTVVDAEAESAASFNYQTASIVNGDSAAVSLTLNKEALDNGYSVRSSDPEVLSIDENLMFTVNVPEDRLA